MFSVVGQDLPDDLRGLLFELCRRWAWCVGGWNGKRTEFWLEFFASVAAASKKGGLPTLDDLIDRFRGSAPYKAWARRVSLQAPTTWSTIERVEIEQWPEGRLEDTKIAAWLLAGESESPEVQRWVNRFNVKAMMHCTAWQHPFQGAQELIGDFWVWALRTELFSKFSPVRGSLFHFAFKGFRQEFLDWGKRAASDRARQDTLDDQFSTASDALSPLDVLVREENRRRVQECLSGMGMGVGEAGWLLWQIDLMGSTYGELADTEFDGAVEAGALRVRASRARKRFKVMWESRFDVTDETVMRPARDQAAWHPSDEEKLDVAYGDLADADRPRIETHLTVCDECRTHVARLRDALAHAETPEGRERIRQLWTSFREAADQMRADAQNGAASGVGAAAARAHEQYLRSAPAGSESRPWAELADDLKRSNYHQIAHARRLVTTVGLGVRDRVNREAPLLDMEQELGPDGIHRLARLEHERFVAERVLQGWRYGETKDVEGKRSPYLVGWDELPAEIQQLDVDAVKGLPAAFAEIGLEVFVLADTRERKSGER